MWYEDTHDLNDSKNGQGIRVVVRYHSLGTLFKFLKNVSREMVFISNRSSTPFLTLCYQLINMSHYLVHKYSALLLIPSFEL